MTPQTDADANAPWLLANNVSCLRRVHYLFSDDANDQIKRVIAGLKKIY